MDLEVNYSNVSNAQEAFSKVKKAITAEAIAKYKVKATLSYEENKKIIATGKGFDLVIDFKDSSAAVTLKLGLLYKAFRKPVLDGFEKQLRRVV